MRAVVTRVKSASVTIEKNSRCWTIKKKIKLNILFRKNARNAKKALWRANPMGKYMFAIIQIAKIPIGFIDNTVN